MTKKSQETKAKILKTASKLFAKQGVDNTSLREITAAADVNLAAINYHFGGKDALVAQILMGFISPLDVERRQILKNAQTASDEGALRVRDILTAYLQPWLHFMDKHPGMLAGYVQQHTNDNNKSEGTKSLKPMFLTIVQGAHQELLDYLAQALPDVSRDVLLLRLNIIGTLAITVLFTPWFGENVEAMSGFGLTKNNLIEFATRLMETGTFETN